MTSRRSAQGWWTRRAESRQNLQLLPPAPRMVGPMPLYPLVKPQLVPKPAAPKSAPAATSRMDKVTSIEKRLMAQELIDISKRDGTFGYVQKLVKRGLFRQVSTDGLRVRFQKVSPREQAGRELSALIAGKTAFASGNTMRAVGAS